MVKELAKNIALPVIPGLAGCLLALALVLPADAMSADDMENMINSSDAAKKNQAAAPAHFSIPNSGGSGGGMNGGSFGAPGGNFNAPSGGGAFNIQQGNAFRPENLKTPQSKPMSAKQKSSQKSYNRLEDRLNTMTGGSSFPSSTQNNFPPMNPQINRFPTPGGGGNMQGGGNTMQGGGGFGNAVQGGGMQGGGNMMQGGGGFGGMPGAGGAHGPVMRGNGGFGSGSFLNIMKMMNSPGAGTTGGARGGMLNQKPQQKPSMFQQAFGGDSSEGGNEAAGQDAYSYVSNQLSKAKSFAAQAGSYMEQARYTDEQSAKSSAANESVYFANQARIAAEQAESRASGFPNAQSLASQARGEANRARSYANQARDAASGW